MISIWILYLIFHFRTKINWFVARTLWIEVQKKIFWKKNLLMCYCGAATLNERIIVNWRSRICYLNLRSFCRIETKSISCNSLIVMHLLKFLSAPYLWFQIIKPLWIPEVMSALIKQFHVKDIWSLWYTLEAF